ncbi:MAG: hypothetical protein AB7S81_07250, partial [Bdellovibrionales bacterium]
FANHIPKILLLEIIQPRLEEILEMVSTRLEKSGFSDIAGKRAVLTGGGSQLPGIRDMASRILDKQVRLGRPLRITRPYVGHEMPALRPLTGLAEASTGPAFSTIAGLLVTALQPEMFDSQNYADYASGSLGRLRHWIRQNL